MRINSTRETTDCELITLKNIRNKIKNPSSSSIKCKYLNSCIIEMVSQTNKNKECKNEYDFQIFSDGNYIFTEIKIGYMQRCIFKIKTKIYYDTLKNHLINLSKFKSSNTQNFYNQLNMLSKKCPGTSHFFYKLKNINNLPLDDFYFFEKEIIAKYRKMFIFFSLEGINFENDKIKNSFLKKYNYIQKNANKSLQNLTLYKNDFKDVSNSTLSETKNIFEDDQTNFEPTEIFEDYQKINADSENEIIDYDAKVYIKIDDSNEYADEKDGYLTQKDVTKTMQYLEDKHNYTLYNIDITSANQKNSTTDKIFEYNYTKNIDNYLHTPDTINFNKSSSENHISQYGVNSMIISFCTVGFLFILIFCIIGIFKYKKRLERNGQRQDDIFVLSRLLKKS